MKRPDWRSALLANWRQQPDRATALQRYARLAVDYENATTRIREVRRRAIELLAPSLGETVFDLACGAGAMLPELASRVGPQGRVIGVEQSPAMAALARKAIGGIRQAELLVAPVESFIAPQAADALLFIYAHDVQQNQAALTNAFAQARPGARVVVAGLCLLPWWGLPINAWVLWGARHYLTTWHGLSKPWLALEVWCPDLRIVDRHHLSTGYLAVGTVSPR